MVVELEDDMPEASAAEHARMAVSHVQDSRSASHDIWRRRFKSRIGCVVSIGSFFEGNRLLLERELDGTVLMIAGRRPCDFGDSCTKEIRAYADHEEQRGRDGEPASLPWSTCRGLDRCTEPRR